MTMGKPRLISVLMTCVVVSAVFWGVLDTRRGDAPDAAVRMKIERFIDSPHRIEFWPGESAVDLRPVKAGYRWASDEVKTRWRKRGGPGRVLFRSPRVEISSLDEIDSIVVSFTALEGVTHFSLVWGKEPEMSERDYLQNRREVTVMGAPPARTFWIRGDDMAYKPLVTTGTAQEPIHYLFFRFPADAEPVFESVNVITKAELFAAQPFGQTRHTVRGEVRDALYVRAPGAVTYDAVSVEHAELSFGVYSLDPEAELHCTVKLGREPDTLILFDRRIPGAGKKWHDFRVVLPRGRVSTPAGSLLTLSAESSRPNDTVMWSNPAIWQPSRKDVFPNVVLYVADALRADHLGFAGYPKATSPFLDELARQGVVFTHCYAQATWTKPSIASLLTSLNPQTHGVGARSSLDGLPESVETLADYLRAQGYVTAQFSANPFASTLSNLDQGFDTVLNPEAFEVVDAAAKKNKIHSDDLNKPLLRFLDAHARDRFFVYVHSIDTHVPWSRHEDSVALGGGEDEVGLYDGSISFNDRQLRRLYEKLTDLGIAENTLFVLTADHGEALNEHGRFGHGLSVYQEETRIPLLLVRPGALKPRPVHSPVQEVDIMPTVLKHCGIPFEPHRLQGKDLLVDREPVDSGRVFTTRYIYPDALELRDHGGHEQYAIIEGTWKLILTRSPKEREPRFELYDLAGDPLEKKNLAGERREKVESLHHALSRFLEEQGRARADFLRAHPDEFMLGRPAGAGSVRDLLPQDALERLRALGYVK